MAEAQQEQPQAHQPQPEPVIAAAEELAHALPHPSQAPSPLPEATQEQDTIQQGAQGQVRAEAHVTTSRGPDASLFDHARARTPNLRVANNATTDVAVAHAQEQERAQEQGQGHQSLQHFSSNHSTDVVNSISTAATVSPVTVPSTTTFAAADQATLSSATAATNGAPPDQQHEQEHQRPQNNGIAPPPSSSDAMSNNPSHHPPGPPRQPTNYSNPPAYATPGMGGAHYGYANPTGQGPDAYRASTSVNVPNNAMALPSMRTFDPAQQQAQQQQHMAMAMPVNPVPSVPSMPAQQHMTYFGQQAVPMTANNPYALPPDALRPQYALPPSGPGSVLGGRHKKEIKRRTKTGCLTCRKRRIKCDEQHPICKNCQKSKRECLGYDPIFKNQQQQHPTSIRPAPNSTPGASVSAPAASSSRPPTTSAPASGAVQAQTPYATLPPVISNTITATTTPTTTSFVGSLTAAGTAVSAIKGEPLEYPTTIDPTLDTVLSSSSMSTSHYPAIKHFTPHPIHHSSQGAPHLRGGGPSSIPLHPSASPSSSHQQIPAYTGFPARKMKVHELVSMSGAVPPALDSPLTNEKLAEVRDLYDQVYAPGLEKFFETEWYTKPQGLGALVSNAPINETLAGFLQSMAKTDPNDVAGMQYSANLEFRVVWDLASLVYTSEYKINVGEHLPPPDDGAEARNRVAVFEALLSGGYIDQNPLHPAPANADIRLRRIREFNFWYCLAEFLRVRDHPGLDMARQRDYILGQMRELLDGRENRDVLYSLAVIRALSPNFPPDFESTLPPHLDESDPKNKLAVARKFIQDESQVTGGTTNVVRRFAELAVRAFIVPGSNITRR
ncbi:hypothetical protein F4677DRAFT_64391 [Hypoxylon crocopeplum]|nr:hypothetical protein F4677DRAFT_64391 [Hypoxylon crocopeplum]